MEGIEQLLQQYPLLSIANAKQFSASTQGSLFISRYID